MVHLESGEDVDAGVDGELVFRGPFTSPSVAKGVWFRTGDMGHYDERGNFYVVDRIDDLIRYRGSVVRPLLRPPPLPSCPFTTRAPF